MSEDWEDFASKLNLTEDEKMPIWEAGSTSTSAANVPNSWLVGKLLTERVFNKFRMINSFKDLWRVHTHFSVSTLGHNMFIFKFHNEMEAQRVLHGEPWAFQKSLLVLVPYNADFTANDYDFSKTKFWIRIYKIPVGAITSEKAAIIGNKIGKYIDLDDSFYRGGSADCIRIRVQLDLSFPLRRLLKYEDWSGNERTARIRYERLPDFCYICGLIGHMQSDCQAVGIHDRDKNEFPYGSWLVASPQKSASLPISYIPSTDVMPSIRYSPATKSLNFPDSKGKSVYSLAPSKPMVSSPNPAQTTIHTNQRHDKDHSTETHIQPKMLFDDNDSVSTNPTMDTFMKQVSTDTIISGENSGGKKGTWKRKARALVLMDDLTTNGETTDGSKKGKVTDQIVNAATSETEHCLAGTGSRPAESHESLILELSRAWEPSHGSRCKTPYKGERTRYCISF